MTIAGGVMIVALRFAFANIAFFDHLFEGFSQSINHYIESEIEGSVFGRSTGEIIIYFTRFLATFLLTISVIKTMLTKGIKIPQYIHSLMSLSIALLFFAFAFMVGNFDNGTLAWRYITISWFPLVFVACFFKENKILSRKIWKMASFLLLISFEASLTIPIFYASVQ
jgi:hypothetical protein